MLLLKQHKNRLHELIVLGKLDPKFFDASDVVGLGGDRFRIRLVNSPMLFEASYASKKGEFLFRWRATYYEASFPEYEGSSRVDEPGLDAVFRDWLKEVKRYIKDEHFIPDRWQQLRESQQLVSFQSAPETEATPFSENEKVQLRLSIEKVRSLAASSLKLSKAEFALLNTRLDHLSGALDKLSRFDWKGALVATLLSASINLTLDKATGNQLLQIFQDAFASVQLLLQ